MVSTAKFGGSSLADAHQFRRVADIIGSDAQRRYIVPSAPGKRTAADTKVTDLLYACVSDTSAFERVRERYQAIAAELDVDMDAVLASTKKDIEDSTPDFVASRGEYLNGRLLAAYLDMPFCDAADLLFFNEHGVDFDRTYTALGKLSGCAIIPGFYGRDNNGRIKTFSRGGSDISGALVAAGTKSSLYENWTDVCGLLMADPRIVDNPKPMRHLSYRELGELAYNGATVLHDQSVFPARRAGIPINIRNTNLPADAGTLISSAAYRNGPVTGIAGKQGFTAISVEKEGMNPQVGFARKVLTALEEEGISFDHPSSSMNSLTVLAASANIKDRKRLEERIRCLCAPDAISFEDNLAVIATVGEGMVRTPGIAARLFAALANVNVRTIDQGSSEVAIIVGVSASDYVPAVRAIYKEFA